MARTERGKPCVGKRSRGHIFSVLGARATLHMGMSPRGQKGESIAPKEVMPGNPISLWPRIHFGRSWAHMLRRILGQVRYRKRNQIIGQR